MSWATFWSCDRHLLKEYDCCSAFEDFNNAVVLTNRPLRPNELFQVRLDNLVIQWTGSIEIGVTTHSPLTLEFPTTMTNVRTGTWIMTGKGVMQNGAGFINEYGYNLDKLQVEQQCLKTKFSTYLISLLPIYCKSSIFCCLLCSTLRC